MCAVGELFFLEFGDAVDGCEFVVARAFGCGADPEVDESVVDAEEVMFLAVVGVNGGNAAGEDFAV